MEGNKSAALESQLKGLQELSEKLTRSLEATLEPLLAEADRSNGSGEAPAPCCQHEPACSS